MESFIDSLCHCITQHSETKAWKMAAAEEKEINRLLVLAGYKETEVDELSKCVRAGLIRGNFGFKFTGDQSQLDAVVLEGKCVDFSYEDCPGVLKATVRDLLKQQDYAGTDYEENSSEAPVKCKCYFHIILVLLHAH